MKRIGTMLLVILFVVVLVLTNQELKPETLVYAKTDVRLIDWESPTVIKPTICRLTKGQVAGVVKDVVYRTGSSDSIDVLWVRDTNKPFCYGGATKDHFKAK